MCRSAHAQDVWSWHARCVSSPPLDRRFSLLLRNIGAVTWIAIAATTLAQAPVRSIPVLWYCATLTFALCLWYECGRRNAAYVAMAGEGVALLGMVAVACNGFEGLLLVLIAAQLGYRASPLVAGVGASAGALGLFLAIAYHWSLRSACLLTAPYLGFSILMMLCTRLLRQEQITRAELGATLDELRTAQAALARTARLDERLRISECLHDSLGHHLTALSLNLEVAAHAASDAALSAIRSARELAHTSLSEVRSLVREAKEERHINLEQELRQLAEELPHPKLHLAARVPFGHIKPEVAGLLLRSIQEVTTNSIRHGRARNLWISLQSEQHTLALVARDDGPGTAEIHCGFGLTSLRRRVEGLGGNVGLVSAVGQGFEVRLTVPDAIADPP
jgi:signal transduction histidine kinase